MSSFYELPTVEQVNEFVRSVNAGRAEARLPRIGTLEQVKHDQGYVALEFDQCEPGNPYKCLSATMLAAPLGFSSGSSFFTPTSVLVEQNIAAIEAAGAVERNFDYDPDNYRKIPEAILRITDPFDHEITGLREVFVEAGYVE